MTYRFRTSKFKNAAPRIGSRHDPWIRELCLGSYNCYGNLIKSSAAYTAFNVQATGSQLGIACLDSPPLNASNLLILNAHSQLVTDFEFSPFEDNLLASGSADSTVKIWSIKYKNLQDISRLNPECVTSSKNHKRVESLKFNPTVEYLISYTSHNAFTLWDILSNKEYFYDDTIHEDTIMSTSWNLNGNTFTTCAKDKKVRIIDVRSSTSVVASTGSHGLASDSRILWLGDSHFIISTGFDNNRNRQVFIRDTRSFSEPVIASTFDSPAGITIPLFDPDTNMLFLASRGEASIYYAEFITSELTLNEGYRYLGEYLTKGACLVPKRALNVEGSEVNRIVQLNQNSVVNIPYFIPKRFQNEFQPEIFPATRGTETNCTVTDWLGGKEGVVEMIDLNPENLQSAASPEKGRIVFKNGLQMKKINELNDESNNENDKKTIPAPRPRKKSFSSEENIEITPNNNNNENRFKPQIAPVPRPRVNNPNSIMLLRTPNSFISNPFKSQRKSQGELNRSLSNDETEEEDEGKVGQNANNSNQQNNSDFHEQINHQQNIINNNHIDTNTNYTSNESNSQNSNNQLIIDSNGNGHSENDDHSVDGPLSMPDRRKIFESRSHETDPVNQNTQGNPQPRKPRTTLADRMKIFQEPQTSANSTSSSNANGNHAYHHQEIPHSKSDSAFNGMMNDMVENKKDDGFKEENGHKINEREETEEIKKKLYVETKAENQNNDYLKNSNTSDKVRNGNLPQVVEMHPAVNKSVTNAVVHSINESITAKNTKSQTSDTHNINNQKPQIVKPERKNLPSSVVSIKPNTNCETNVKPKDKVNESTQRQQPENSKSSKRIDTVFGKVSKYRNFKAVALHKRFHIENLRNISTTCPGESELIQANSNRVAVPLNTPGGKVAIFELNRPGRQPDGVIPALVHGTKVMDFMWDPFDNNLLLVGCDDGRICLWRIPNGGLVEQTNKPIFSIAAHAEKIYFVRYHPLAKDVVATSSYDLTIKIWDLDERKMKIYIQAGAEQIQIFSFAWSTFGSKFATASKDGKIRIFEPRKTTEPIIVGKGPQGVRGGRVCWALDEKYLIMAGFDRSSERQVHMYNAADLSSCCVISLDVSPAILVPFYDEDSSILFLSGRGDSTIFTFDVMEELSEGKACLRQLNNHRCPGANHQGVSFLKKNACHVQNVEFARSLRLTENTIEPWSFTVPRVKSEFFQDDLFPPTKVLWEPTMTKDQWFKGEDLEPKRISLKPENMKSNE